MTRPEIIAVPGSEKSDLWAMYQDYARELAPLANIAPIDGEIPDPRFDDYWGKAEHWPYWLVLKVQRIGFAFIRFAPEHQSMQMAQFYIAPDYRGRGAGLVAARALLARHAGPWRIRQMAANRPAVAFWRRVVEPYGYSERCYADQGVDRVEQMLVVT